MPCSYFVLTYFGPNFILGPKSQMGVFSSVSEIHKRHNFVAIRINTLPLMNLKYAPAEDITMRLHVKMKRSVFSSVPKTLLT